jgi:hypothetical protein
VIVDHLDEYTSMIVEAPGCRGRITSLTALSK